MFRITGVSEETEDAFMVLDTEDETEEECSVADILQYLRDKTEIEGASIEGDKLIIKVPIPVDDEEDY